MDGVIRISEHAVDRYLERLDPHATRDEARGRLTELVAGGTAEPVRGTNCVLVPLVDDMAAVVDQGVLVTIRYRRRLPRGR